MIGYLESKRSSLTYRFLSAFIAFTFVFSVIVLPSKSLAQTVSQTILNLPVPGVMVPVSQEFTPVLIRGVTINPADPLQFDFIVDTGNTGLNIKSEEFKSESQKLIKYFLSAITVPGDEQWVNLSPIEKDRIIPEGLGVTELGQDLLSQDYVLKQLVASLAYPENELGEEFWNRVYAKAQARFGTTEIPMNTFNKIWIVPEKAVVYEHEATVFVLERHLKVMLEEDYLALQDSVNNPNNGLNQQNTKVMSGISSEVVREILIPEIEKEINQGENFANLRQIYNSMILATWYKQNLKESLLGQVYMNQNKVEGIDVEDKEIKQKIYDQYLEAFQKGVYSYIKEDIDFATQQRIPRKYFSGGAIGVKTVESVTYGRSSSSMVLAAQSKVSTRVGDFGVVNTKLFENLTEEAIVANVSSSVSSPVKKLTKVVKFLRNGFFSTLLWLMVAPVSAFDMYESTSVEDDNTGVLFGVDIGGTPESINGMKRRFINTRDREALDDLLDFAFMMNRELAIDALGELAREDEEVRDWIEQVGIGHSPYDNVQHAVNIGEAGVIDSLKKFVAVTGSRAAFNVLFKAGFEEEQVLAINALADVTSIEEGLFRGFILSNWVENGLREDQWKSNLQAKANEGDPRFITALKRMIDKTGSPTAFDILLEAGFKHNQVKAINALSDLAINNEEVYDWIESSDIGVLLANLGGDANDGYPQIINALKFMVAKTGSPSAFNIVLNAALEETQVLQIKESEKSSGSLGSIKGRKGSQQSARNALKYLLELDYLLDLDVQNILFQNGLEELASNSASSVIKSATVGGINLDPTLLDLQIKRDGKGVPLPVSQQPFDSMNIKGFLPVIINVQPVINLPLLIGFDTKSSYKLTSLMERSNFFDKNCFDIPLSESESVPPVYRHILIYSLKEFSV